MEMNLEMARKLNRSDGKSYMLALISLTLGAFAIGMAEFVIMGLLPNIANEYNITISKAGLLITGYAMGVAIGGPIMAMLTFRMPRKRMLCALMLIFIIGNVLASVSPNYTVLMIARVIASLAHGTFLGVSALIAASLVAPEKRASALATITAGMTIANVVGVPFGTLIGQKFGWEATFMVIAVLGILTFIGIIFLVKEIPVNKNDSLRKEIYVFLKPQVLFAIAIIIFGFGGLFTAFTYIVPILTDITSFKAENITLILVMFGIAVTLGNIVGGKLADWRPVPTLIVNFSLVTIILLIFNFTDHHRIPALITIFVWGFFSYSLIPALQLRVLEAAKDAQTLASTAIHSAFNVANAAGATLGGLTVSGMGLHHLPWVASIVTFSGLMLMLVSLVMERRSRKQTSPQAVRSHAVDKPVNTRTRTVYYG